MESTNFTEQTLHSEKQSLSSIHLSWGFPTDDELLWLLDQGIDENALWPISGAAVCFDAGTFELSDDGERALIFRAEDRAEVIDLIAYQPHTGTVASWRGQAFCLGETAFHRCDNRLAERAEPAVSGLAKFLGGRAVAPEGLVQSRPFAQFQELAKAAVVAAQDHLLVVHEFGCADQI